MKSSCLLLVGVWVCIFGLVVAAPHDRQRRDVIDTVKSMYKTVALGSKAVFNDVIGNNHVAVESYRQAQDESRKVGPAFSEIFVNPNKVTVAPGPPPKVNPEWNA